MIAPHPSSPAIVFAMKYPDSAGNVWLRVNRAYDRVAANLREAGIRPIIAYPQVTDRPVHRLEHLEAVQVDLCDFSAANRPCIERFIREHHVRTIVFREVPVGEVALNMLHRLGVRTINYIIHGFPKDLQLTLGKRIVNTVRATTGLHHHDMYIANSRDGYDVLVNKLRYPSRRLRIVRNGVDTERFTPRNGSARPDPARWNLPVTDHYVLIVSQAREEKRGEFLIDVAAETFRRRANLSASFVYVGDGGMRAAWEQLVADRGIADRFHFIGQQHDVAPFYHLADVMLHAARLEAFGNVVAEAMASAVPVICTDVGGPRELVVHGRCGYRHDLDDRDGFVDSLLTLLDDADLRRQMGCAGRQRIETLFSLEREVAELSDLLIEEVGAA
jgi:glycosyltransferase involved in cell wall biosynthesis